MKINLNFFLSFSIFLIFPNLIFGPAIPDILISFVGLLGLYQIFKTKNYDLILNKYSYVFFIWYFYLIILSFFAKDQLLSFESSLFYFRFYLFSLVIIYLLKTEIFFKKNIYLIILFTYYFIIFISLTLILIPEINLPFIDSFDENSRLKGPFYENIMGGYLVKLLPFIIISFLLSHDSSFRKLSLIFAFVISSYLIFITGERSAIIMLLLIYLIFFFNKFLSLKFKFIIFTILLFILFSAYYTFPSFNERIIFTFNQFNIFDNEMLSQNIYFKYFQN